MDEEDGSKEGEATGKEEHEKDWFEKFMRPFNPDEEEAAEEQEGEHEGARKAKEEATDEQEGELEEARKAKGIKAPTKPSKEEVNEHMLTHLPFRSWCPHCVRGKSKGRPHRKTEGDPHLGARLHVHARVAEET